MHDDYPNPPSQSVGQPVTVEADQVHEQRPRKAGFFGRVGGAVMFVVETPAVIKEVLTSPRNPDLPHYRPPSSYEIAMDAAVKEIQEIRADPDLSEEEKRGREKRVIEGTIQSTR